MNMPRIHNNYFNKKTNSRASLKKRKGKNNEINNKSNIVYNNIKNNDLFNEKTNVKNPKFNDFQIINNSISTDNQDSIPTMNIALDSDDSINSKKNNNNLGAYLQKLENKIANREKQLSQLLEYKELCEKRIKELNPKEVLPLTIDTLNDYYFSNRDNKNIKKHAKVLNSSYSNKHIKLGLNNLNNYEKTIELNLNKTDDNFYKKKYDNLYKKYTKLYNDFKQMNTSSNNIEINKLKNNIYKLQNEYENILQKYNKEKKINEELKIKINNLEKSIKDNDDIKNAKKWKDQAEMLRKDLVLSQALVNSLKSEIELFYKKNKQNKNIKRSNSYNNKRINSSFDYNVLPYNNNNNFDKINNYDYNLNNMYKNNNFKTINDQNFNLLDENNFLKKSLYNKNLLISNMLEENNKLNNIIKSYDNNNNLKKNNNNNNNNDNNYNNNNNLNNENIEEMKNNLSQYENKLVYFNNYISNIKKQLYKLHQDLIQIINNIKIDKNKNKDDKNKDSKDNDMILSENFEKEIENIKNKLNDINIDFYNLDYSNDIKCIDSNMELIKIINEELKKLLITIEKNNFINKKEIKSIIDLFELSKTLIKDESLKKTLNDIFNITQNINKLYKQKYLNNNNNINEDNNDLDKILATQEKELELIKKSLLDITNKTNTRKTYYIINNYNNKLNKNSNQMNDYNENINYNPNFTENYNLNRNIRNDNNYVVNNNYYNGNNYDYLAKRFSNSRDKIINN